MILSTYPRRTLKHAPRKRRSVTVNRRLNLAAWLFVAVLLAAFYTASAIGASRADGATQSVASVKAERDYWRTKHATHHKVWSEATVRFMLGRACDHYGITGSEKAWVIGAGTHIAYGESRFNTKARNGQHRGLMQFNGGWKGTEAQKLSGVWSCYRFVRVFDAGGKAKIRQHWRATVGSW